MAGLHPSTLRQSFWVVAAFIAVICAVSSARAATAPADPCSLLPAATVGQAVGSPFNPPKSSVAPRPYANTAQGTDCNYSAKNGNKYLLFRVYFDPSDGDATTLFAKLKMFFGQSTAVSGVGDEAYLDENEALHARKGNVRFYLEMGQGNEAPLKALGVQVAGAL